MQRIEHALHPWVLFGVMPLFAFANAGVVIEGDLASTLGNRVTLGVILGLMIGKQVGITLFAWLATRLGLATLPDDVGWRQIYGVGWLAGIGFTMSLFIADLAFDDSNLLASAKVGILVASIVAGGIGYVLLSRSARGAWDRRRCRSPCHDQRNLTQSLAIELTPRPTVRADTRRPRSTRCWIGIRTGRSCAGHRIDR